MSIFFSSYTTIDEIYSNEKYDEFEQNINSFFNSINVHLTLPEDKNQEKFQSVK